MTNNRYGKIMMTAGLVLLAALAPGFAQNALVTLDRIYPGELREAGFRLSAETEIDIEAVGAYFDDGRDEQFIYGYAWILDAKTRDLVWQMPPADFPRRRPEAQETRAQRLLPAGDYIAYYSSYPAYERRNNRWGRGRSWAGRLIGDIFGNLFSRNGWRNWDDVDDDGLSRDFRLEIRGRGTALDAASVRKMEAELEERALLSMRVSRDDAYQRQGFRLRKPMEIEIYAIGELRETENFDYGMILNANTREKVWILDYDRSEPAGGATKNRSARSRIDLPAGDYVAMVATDDSHSPAEWNAPPPHDPAFWGMTLMPASNANRADFELYTYERPGMRNAIVEFTRVRGDAFLEKGFTLNRDLTVRILALGEGRRDGVYDYGWIVDAKTRRKVWEMDYYNTGHAGGGSKNIEFDGTIDLKKGDYVAYFVTDDSHHYGDWNTAPPYDQESWGMVVMPADDRFRAGDVRSYDPDDDRNVLAKVTRVRDDAYRHARFTLDREMDVRVYALGEGSDGRMYDYGWIEDANGRTVWEMTWRKTEHAGGAEKNRMFNDVVRLGAGDYKLRYESDGSHSFNDWNASPPHDPQHWGITVYRNE